MDAHATQVLTINTGSSSLKAAVYHIEDRNQRLLSAEARQIGLDAGHLTITAGSGATLLDESVRLSDHRAALERLFAWLADHDWTRQLAAVGHRVVHGGSEFTAPRRIDAALVKSLEALVPLAPDHLPQAIAAIAKVNEAWPAVPQVACFDTAFHAMLPTRARLLPLVRAWADEGIVRYGFHGLSYEYLAEQLRAIDPLRGGGRAVLAHLGNGASMAAVVDGRSIDTSMGFTPAGGLVMGTRSGDLDPGVLVYLLQTKRLQPRELNQLVNTQSGLAGISELSSDVRVLLERRESDPRAAEAIDIFCYQARKFLGAYAFALGGLDQVVFSGGIGENAPDVRAQICADLDFAGIRLDPARNRANDSVISSDASGVTVRVIRTDEDLMIARHTQRLLARKEE
jgi:acetate kinase